MKKNLQEQTNNHIFINQESLVEEEENLAIEEKVPKQEPQRNVLDQKIQEMYFSKEGTKVDQDAIKGYKEYRWEGPKVGEVELLDKKTNTIVKIEIHKAKGRAQEEDQEGFFLVDPDGVFIGEIYLRKDLPGGAMDRGNYGAGWSHSHYMEENYGNGEERLKRPSKIFIEMTERKNYVSEKYKDVGKVLTELAVERSLQLGADGRVLLQAAFYSFGFWKKMGFVPQDVNKEDGTLHHKGQELLDRYNSALERTFEICLHLKEGASPEEIEAEKKRIIKEFRVLDLQFEDLAIMYLPPDAIENYKAKIAKNGPHITTNATTMKALDLKQKLLAQQGFDKKKIDEILENEKIKELIGSEVTEKNYEEYWKLEKLAQLYANVGEEEKSKVTYEKMALAGEMEFNLNLSNQKYYRVHHSQAVGVAEYWENAGQQSKALKFWEYAGEQASSGGEFENAAIYFGRAGRQDKAGQVLEQTGEIYREW